VVIGQPMTDLFTDMALEIDVQVKFVGGENLYVRE
jgi:hypothetical protein